MRHEDTDAGPEGLLVLAELAELVRRYRRTFLALGGLGLLAGLLLVTRQAPTYRAEATLLLESEHGAGVLGDLAALTSAPQAISEMEVLRSRTVAEAVVDGEASGTPALTTLVESARLAPLSGLLGLGGADEWEELGRKPRLGARVAGDPDRVDPPVLVARFTAPGRVELSERGPLPGLPLGGGAAREYAFVPGEVLEHAGMSVALWPDGDLVGETFYLHALRFEEAVERLMESTRVSETQRGSGVIRVVHDDADPERAAATANALCAIYLERNQSRQEKRASQTVEFIQAQLEE